MVMVAVGHTVPEKTLVLGSTSVALVEGFTPITLVQGTTETRSKRGHVESFHLYKASKTGKTNLWCHKLKYVVTL